MNLLSGKNLHFNIDHIPILKNVSVDVNAGEVVGLIGPNGAGKSTLLRLLTQVETAAAGTIEWHGKPINTISQEERAKKIGYLVQNARAHWPFSVQKLVELGRIPHQRWWQDSSVEDLQKVETAMRLTETLAYRNRLVTTLSGGEQTLVMLARIFATEPQLIFADEPVAALDPYHQLHVMEILRAHAQQQNAAVVVLHDLSLAARFCDRLYLLNHGELYCSGTPQQVLTPENIAHVYGVKSVVNCSEAGVSVTPVSRLKDHHP
jgi:ABC-type cobalamin/Fe3+-siderophores transport system ATPase subunit